MGSPWWTLPWLSIAALALMACQPAPRYLTVVTGKTVRGDLALEGVTLKIHKREEAGWKYHGEAESGYHGTFRLHLSPGVYRITASKRMRLRDREILLTGTFENLVVGEGDRRWDQLVVELGPVGENRPWRSEKGKTVY